MVLVQLSVADFELRWVYFVSGLFSGRIRIKRRPIIAKRFKLGVKDLSCVEELVWWSLK